MAHTAQHSVSMCVSEALSFFSGFRVEQTLLKHTGPHAHTNTINSGACLHLHLFPDQKTHTHAVTHMHPYTHKNSLSLRNANAKKSVSVIHRWEVPVWDKWTETPFICLIYCVKSTLHLHCVHWLVSYTCPWITFLHGLAGVLTSSLTHYLHIVLERKEVLLFSDPLDPADTWSFQTEPSLT